MEGDKKLCFVKNGVLRLPPGFRFHPTDEELVVQYLKRKVLSCPLPASVIPEFDVCKSDPWNLPGDSEKERYFFSTKEAKYPNGNRSNRATKSGYWKATGLDKKIVTCKGNNVVGIKKTLVFYRGKPPKGTRTDWIMHEYRLANTQPAHSGLDVGAANWVLCRIFLKKRGSKNNDDDKDERINENKLQIKNTASRNQPVFYEFLTKGRTDLNAPPPSSSTGSSGITEDENSCDEIDDREENSSCNSFPCFRRNL